ncbi:MAG: hypothetical protein ACFUZC_02220 [Chthoniobacteraceae bacterium]
MKLISQSNEKAAVLPLALVVMGVLAILSLSAYEVTGSIGQNTRRIAVRQQALSIADSSLEALYCQFKSIVSNYSTSLGDLAPSQAYCSGTLTGIGFKTAKSWAPTGAAFPELASYFPSVSNFSALHLDDSSVGVIKNYALTPLDKNGRVSASAGAVQTVTPTGSSEGRAFRYLATVDVELPTLSGSTVKAHVSRVFEYQVKSFLNYAIFSNVTLEIHPGSTMVITGPVHSNANMYVGCGGGALTFTDSVTCSGTITQGKAPSDPAHSGASGSVSGTGWTNRVNDAGSVTPLGVSSTSFSTTDSNHNNDSYHEVVETVISPSTYPDPFSPNDARTDTTTQAFDSAELQTMRFANVSDFVITISNSNGGGANTAGDHITISYTSTTDDSSTVTLDSTTDSNNDIYKAFMSALKVDSSFIVDNRESSGSKYTAVNLTTLDVSALKSALDTNKIKPYAGSNTGLGVYIADNRAKVTYTSTKNPTMSSGTIFPALSGTMKWGSKTLTGTSTISGTYASTESAIKIINGSALPEGGLTVVSDNPVYIQGDYNTGSPIVNGTVSTATLSATSSSTWGATHDSTTVTLDQANANQTYPYSSGVSYTNVSGSSGTYYWQPSAIVSDAVSVLSNNWSDSNSNSGLSSRVASAATTVNAAFIAGNVATTSSSYSGGVENFPRLLEDWGGTRFNYVGSLILMYNSTEATGNFSNASYGIPTRRWAYDKNFLTNGVPLLSAGGSSNGGSAGGGSRKTVAAGGGKAFQRKQFISRVVQ